MSELEKEIADSKITALQQEVSNTQKKYDTVVMAVNITFGILFMIGLFLGLVSKTKSADAVATVCFVVSILLLLLGNLIGTWGCKTLLDKRKRDLQKELTKEQIKIKTIQ